MNFLFMENPFPRIKSISQLSYIACAVQCIEQQYRNKHSSICFVVTPIVCDAIKCSYDVIFTLNSIS